MVGASARQSEAPWTVLTQGSHLSYDDQTLLDRLEYSLRVGGPATPRLLEQEGNVSGLTRALSGSVDSLVSAEAQLRAAKLLYAVVEHSAQPGHEASFREFVNGLGSSYFATVMCACESAPREACILFLNATGRAMGHELLDEMASAKDKKTLLDKQRGEYVALLRFLILTLMEETAVEDGEERAQAAAPEAIGYIPTVPGISPSMSAAVTSVGDEQLNSLLSGLCAFLARDENRFIFTKATGADNAELKATNVLASLLDKDVRLPVQVCYQSIFCLWLLSFASQHNPHSPGAESVASAMADAGVPRRLTNVIREVWAEKVIRIALSTLRNLMKMSVTLRKEMVGAGLVGALESLCLRRWNDEDIREDLGVLAEALESELASMTTFDVYRAEILSGALEWTPPHRDETFWKENVEKLESNNMEVLRCLVRILHESMDNVALSVACHDLAQFVKFHSRGRQIAQSLGVKARLMELMASGHGDVRLHALNGVQVLMISHWNLMQRSA